MVVGLCWWNGVGGMMFAEQWWWNGVGGMVLIERCGRMALVSVEYNVVVVGLFDQHCSTDTNPTTQFYQNICIDTI